MENHTNSVAQIGIWSNKTVQRIIEIMVNQAGRSEEVAMERTIEMARINMRNSAEMYKKMWQNKEAMKQDVEQYEIDELNGWAREVTWEIQTQYFENTTESNIKAFRQRWNLITGGKEIRKITEQTIKATRKERMKSRKGKRQAETEGEELEERKTLKKMKGGGMETTEAHKGREQNKISKQRKNIQKPPCTTGGPGNPVPWGGRGLTQSRTHKYYTTLHYTTLHYTTLHYTTPKE